MRSMTTAFRVTGLVALTVIGGVVASVATLFIPQEVRSQAELARVPLGWPFKFLVQNLSDYEPSTWPQWFSFNGPQGHPLVLFDLDSFLADALILGLAVSAAMVLLIKFWRWIRSVA